MARKLDSTMVAEIMCALQDDKIGSLSNVKIGALFGVDNSTIRRIKNLEYKKYKNIHTMLKNHNLCELLNDKKFKKIFNEVYELYFLNEYSESYINQNARKYMNFLDVYGKYLKEINLYPEHAELILLLRKTSNKKTQNNSKIIKGIDKNVDNTSDSMINTIFKYFKNLFIKKEININFNKMKQKKSKKQRLDENIEALKPKNIKDIKKRKVHILMRSKNNSDTMMKLYKKFENKDYIESTRSWINDFDPALSIPRGY